MIYKDTMNGHNLLFLLSTIVCIITSSACSLYVSAHPSIHSQLTQNDTVWVAVDGNDLASGAQNEPLASLEAALYHVRLRRQTSESEILQAQIIMLKGGTYTLPKTVKITAEDSGTESSPTIIQAAEGETPILSGGYLVHGWSKAGMVDGLPEIAQGNVWKASVGSLDFRQMWVNSSKVARASTFDDLSLPRIITVDKKKGELIVPRINLRPDLSRKLEMTIIQDWVVNNMRVAGFESDSVRTTFIFKQPESGIEFKRPWPILRASEESSTNHHFYLSNSIELLDRPQEWFCDKNTNTLYYWPTHDESINDSEVVVPVLETLVQIDGDEDSFVTNICFKGISFEHTTWYRPNLYGHVPLQAGQFIYDAYTDDSSIAGNVAWVGRPSSAVSVKGAQNISFIDCRFEHTGSTALDFISSTKCAEVKGCVFNDVGGSGILAGYFGDESFEAHQAYNPENPRVICDSIEIDNNYFCNTSSEDWGALGICIGFASNITVSHNEIANTNYSAISMGWGWTPDESCMHDNHIVNNYIHGFCNQMRDGGAIYTLSSQRNSSIEGNRIEDAGEPPLNPLMWDIRHAQFDIYLDEGSDYFTVQNNWCERGEYSRNKNGSHNVWGPNGPDVSSEYKNKAGLENEFLHLRESVSANPLHLK